MDPRYTAEIFKHLEMQNELLLESHSSISHQLHKLQLSRDTNKAKVFDEMLNTNYNEMGMSGVNDETEIIANVDEVINIEGTKDLIPTPSSSFKSTVDESKRFARVLAKAFDSEVSPSVGCDNLLLFDQYCQMTTVRTKNEGVREAICRFDFYRIGGSNRFNGYTIQRWSLSPALMTVLVLEANYCKSGLFNISSKSANAYLSSAVGIASIFLFGDDTSCVSLSTIKEGIFKVEEEMLMRKFHELMKAQDVNKKNENNGNISTALVDPACIEGDETGNSAPLVLVKSKEQL
ncbi:hypothetical protein J1N35_006945 [Gossypium stocksii]|uniref:Uncharacterized protein n=1 Tax=Gossypium stocksii TaxID=47602 RepID=A0A9D3W6S7_9ROSI|nr:hypothetical protein J1N35_006945 [Gossypium stocksii]